jgi:thymidine kinase
VAREFAKAFYGSAAWLQCRAAYIVSVFGLCEKCKEPGYIVHHTVELTPENINNPNITLNHELLCYLCLRCHNAIYSEDTTMEGLMFDASGQPVQR